jgi:Flp pilus assembly protein TadD
LIWNRALHKGQLLSEKYQKLMFTSHSAADINMSHGISVDIYLFRPYHLDRQEQDPSLVKYTAFNGNSPGYHTDVFRFLKKDLAVVFCSNSGYVNLWDVAHRIYFLHDGKSVSKPKPYAAHVAARTAVIEGVDEAFKQYRNLQKTSAGEFDWNSTEYWLNTMGYRLLDLGWFEQAIAVLDLNVKLFPNVANTYDSLAEAYLKAGDKEKSDFYDTKAKEIGELENGLLALILAGEFKKARDKINEVRAKDSQRSIFTPSRIGPLYGRTFGEGRNQEAIAICELWALGNPEDVGPYFSMARVYKKTENWEKAKECYNTILALAPQGRHVEMVKKELENLEKK